MVRIYPPPPSDPLTTLQVIDDFVGGTGATTTVGELGWTLAGGSTTALAAEARHPGLLRRDTSTTSGVVAYTLLRSNVSSAGSFHADDFWDVTFVFRLNQVDANTRLRIGVSGNWSSETPVNAAYLEVLTSDTKWFYVTRTGSVETRTDSGTAANTSWHKIRIRRLSASALGFTLDSAAEVSVSSNVPTGTGVTAPGWQIVNTTTASKTVDVDLCILRVTGLNR